MSTSKYKWTLNDEAIHRGINYADKMVKFYNDGEFIVSLQAKLKNAYQEGFLHGFEHKFDQTNYEEK